MTTRGSMVERDQISNDRNQLTENIGTVSMY